MIAINGKLNKLGSINLSDLVTVIIPTCGRQNLFKRIAHLWRDFPFKVIVVDGSVHSSDYFDKNNFTTISYYHFPFLGPFERIFNALSLSSTKFTILCGDDEFILPNVLHHAVTTLQSSPTISFVQPRFIGFDFNPQSGLLLRKIYTEQETSWLEPDDVEQRVAENMLRISPTHVYALSYRSIHMNMFRAASHAGNIPLRGLQETITEILGSHYGHYVITDQFGFLRSFEDPTPHKLGGSVAGPINLTHPDSSGCNYLPINNVYLKGFASSLQAINSSYDDSIDISLLTGFTALSHAWNLFQNYEIEKDLISCLNYFSADPFVLHHKINTDELLKWFMLGKVALKPDSFNIRSERIFPNDELSHFFACIYGYYRDIFV